MQTTLATSAFLSEWPKLGRLEYQVAEGPFGFVLLAWDQTGVHTLLLGEGEAFLREELSRRFPGTLEVLGQGSPQGVGALDVEELLSAGELRQVPLHIQGTQFQVRVWETLRDIPLGQTRTYRQVAEAIGRPGAARAVARACASNSIALLIPCHRVVPSEGGTGGYRWGVDRKKSLLSLEQYLCGEALA